MDIVSSVVSFLPVVFRVSAAGVEFRADVEAVSKDVAYIYWQQMAYQILSVEGWNRANALYFSGNRGIDRKMLFLFVRLRFLYFFRQLEGVKWFCRVPRDLIYSYKELRVVGREIAANKGLCIRKIASKMAFDHLFRFISTEYILENSSFLQRAVQDRTLLSMRRLNLSRFGLTSIPPEVNSLRNLEVVNLYGNQCRILPPLFLPRLLELNIMKNQVCSLSGLNVPKLKALWADQNQFEEVPVVNRYGLMILSLRENRICTVDPLHRYRCLKRVYLEGNPIEKASLV